MFRKGESGMDEKKMILKMVEDGKITAEEGVKLLEALGEEKPQPQQEEPKTTKGELSTRVDWDSDEFQKQKTSYRQSSGTSLFTSFIESAIQKIKDFDLDFNFGTYVEVSHIFHHKNLQAHSLDFSVENGSITIVPWEENDVRIECQAKVYKALDTEEARTILLREAVFDPEGSTLRFYTKVKNIKLQATCYVPKKQYETFKLYSFNGHVKVTDTKAISVETKVVNGSIKLSNTKCERLFAETVSGPIDIKFVSADKAEVKTVNGAIDIDGTVTDIDIETVNGALFYNLEKVEKACYVEAKATTGTVTITLPEDAKIDGKLKTNVGGFSCDLAGFEITEEKKDFVQKSLGFTSNKHQPFGVKLFGETNTGSITVKHR